MLFNYLQTYCKLTINHFLIYALGYEGKSLYKKFVSLVLLIYETLSGDEIRDLILKDIKPTRSFKEEDEDNGKTSSALGSLGLKPKPAI